MIIGILLAAGYSRRFGRQKLLHRLSNGEPIGLFSARAVMPAVDKLIVVIKPEDMELERLYARESIETVICETAHLGMGESLKKGIDASSNASGWLIVLGDMPYIQPDTFHALAGAIRRGDKIVRPVYRDQPGHPVGFAREYYEELMQISGDTGAKEILFRHPDAITLLPCEDRGVIWDIDTIEQIKNDEAADGQG